MEVWGICVNVYELFVQLVGKLMNVHMWLFFSYFFFNTVFIYFTRTRRFSTRVHTGWILCFPKNMYSLPFYLSFTMNYLSLISDAGISWCLLVLLVLLVFWYFWYFWYYMKCVGSCINLKCLCSFPCQF